MAKMAIIGAGSMKFTRKICRDIMRVPELDGSEFSLTDIDAEMLELSAKMLRREIKAHGLSYSVGASTDRREALRDADYALSFVRVGGLEMWRHDVEIPLKYGVDQCIGDTLGPGGILYGQRGVPALVGFCTDLREVGKPGAWLLNYTNPMSILTWAAEAAEGVNVLGLCHGVQGTTEQIRKVLDVPAERLTVEVAGVNHLSWFTRIAVDGKPVSRNALLAAFEAHPEEAAGERCRLDVLKRVGYFNTESNGFTTELLPWYRKRADLREAWIAEGAGGHHQSAISLGGYRANLKAQDEYRASLTKLAESDVKPLDAEARSVEHASYIIEAMETGRPYRGTFNVRNRGCIGNLPSDAIVEAPCYVDRHGVSVPRFGPLPDMCAALCNAMVAVQRLAVKAALSGSRETLKQAAMLDPLTAAVCSTGEISDMIDEMLEAEMAYLPQYRAAAS
ncbi:MAG: alpha-galactosidase [Lentisphaerae bacterium]|nr:alpha-galactosidase [Lentisphaerota bacterium]